MTSPVEGGTGGPLGAAFVDGLNAKQMLVFESLADDYMIEVLTQVADAYADKMLAEAGRAAALTAADVGDVGDAAAAGAGAVDPAIFASVPAAVSESLAATMIPLVAEVYQSSQGKVRAGLITEAGATLPPVHSLDAAAYLRRAPKVFDDIGNQLQANIRAGLAEGFELGESIPQLAQRVRAAAGVTARKATLIARTSVIDASNVGSMDMAKASGIEMQKEWLATVPTDGRTRPTHIAADGQRVDLHAKFKVGSEECDHPGEYTLSLAERGGCRCTQGFIVPRAQVMETTEGQAQTEQRLRELRAQREALGGRTRTTVTGLDPERILQAPSPIVSRRLNQDLWGTAQDPAMKMTVTQLREILKNENITYISKANKKQHIVQRLRSWEIDRGRTVLPPMPTDLAAPAITTTTRLGEFTARWDNPDPGELTGGRIPGVAWDGALRSYIDTGPAGIVVRDLELPNSGYVVKHGRAWRIDGTAYLIETPSAVLGVADQAKVLRILDEMRQVHADIPLAEKYNRRYAWVTGRNPADARWAVRYQIPDFHSAASAGGGDVTVWHQSATGLLPGSPQRLIGTLRHETGHNVDYEYAMRRKPPRGSRTSEWESAGRSDAATGVTAKVKDLKPVSDAGGHPIATTPPDPTKQYPNGISDYGRSEVGEDFAESYEKYLRGVVATGELPGTVGTDLYFRDLYPARAVIFDDLFPDFAKAQLAEIKAARAVAAKGGGRVELRAEARARQLDIDKADHAVAALSDVDELVSKRADVGIVEARLQEGITAKAFTKVEADAIRKAVAIGDATKIDAALARVAKKRGVTFAGRAGELTTMVDVDAPGAAMRSVSGATIRPGAQVRIVRRGATLTRDGETIALEPMTVREVTPDELAGLRQAVVDERTKVANVAAQIRSELDRSPVSAARVGQIADRNNLSLPARRALVEAAKTPDGLKRAVATQMRAAEVKASGVVNRGVVFDPNTMEVRGAAALEPGAKVKVVETGYVTEIDGKQAILRKAVVEPVAVKVPPAKVAKAAAAKAPAKTIAHTREIESRLAILRAEAESLAAQGSKAPSSVWARRRDIDAEATRLTRQLIAEKARLAPPWGGSVSGAERWASQVSVTRSTLPADEFSKLRDAYVVNDARTLANNASLRSGHPTSAAKSWASRIRRMIHSQQTTADTTVYRGFALTPDEIVALRPGATFVDDGIVSVDAESTGALFYAGERARGQAGTMRALFEIRVPEGTPAAGVNYGEYVLDGGRYRVLSMKMADDGTVYDPTKVGQPGSPSWASGSGSYVRVIVELLPPSDRTPGRGAGRKASLVPAKAADAAKQADVARAFAGLAIDVEENAANGASVKAIQHRVRSALKKLQIEKTPKGYVWHRGGVDVPLTGRVTGDIEIDAAQQMADLAADVERLTDRGATSGQLINATRAHSLARGLEPTAARAGDVVPFDREAYDMSGARPAAGAPVLVVRPGYTTVINGERVVIEKPLVLSAPGQKFTSLAPEAGGNVVSLESRIDQAVAAIPTKAPRRSRAALKAELQRQAEIVPTAVREFQGMRIATRDEWKDIRPDETDRAWAAYVTGGEYPGQILLHPRWGDLAERAKIEAVVRRAYDTGDLAWSFPGYESTKKIDVIAGIMRHEFGHYVSKKWPLAVKGEVWGPVTRRKLLVPLADELGVPPMPEGGDFVDWFNRTEVQRAIRSKVSAYAAQGPDELLAEIWAVYSGRGDDASKIAKRIGKIMADAWA